MKKTNGFLILLALIAVILLGFIAGKVAEPPQAAPTYTPWPTYTPMPTYTPYPTLSPFALSNYLGEYPSPAIMKDYPRVDGSTSTKPLADLIICELFGLPCRWAIIPGDSRAFRSERFIQFTEYSEGDYFIVPHEIVPNPIHSGTHGAYVNLINKKTDFILVARLPSADELAEAKAKGVILDAQPVALDAFVILAHADNPVNNLTLNQIRGIYSGRITNWAQIGGNDQPIHAYQREENSGSQELLKALVMIDLPTIDAPEMIVETMAGPFNAIQGLDHLSFGTPGDPNGIGYSVYYYTWFIMGPLQDVKILAVEGVRPTSKTIANRTYPLAAEVYVVTRAGESSDSTSVWLRDWLLTDDGQRVVAESGYVPITPLP